ncbi:MAG TPA: formylglycine-generating enzyme family protein [Caulobacteraceae bacterium]|nr:formylglycine-generating enzyme family protein [Caulobacteraceae bacterium]
MSQALKTRPQIRPQIRPQARPKTRTREDKAAARLVWIDGARFRMGSDVHYPEEAPSRLVEVDGFWIEDRPVTNRAFARFTQATGWVTSAEIPPDPADYPGALPEMLTPASLVFTPTEGPVSFADAHAWWAYIPGADWRHPLGPGSNLDGLDDHPVVHVAWRDVTAYAAWAGLDLPTEAEWELACRSGLDGAEYAWAGASLTPGGQHMANIWQGRFPWENLALDGWARTSPVASYPPNRFGLYDMIGNVWEWTRDWWASAAPARGCCVPKNPLGGAEADSCDARELPARIPRKVLKGGSHLCAPSYCRRYRPAARHAHPIDTSTSHVGFRCVRRRAAR